MRIQSLQKVKMRSIKMPKYKCIGCGEIHNDNDYSKEDGDILIGKREEELKKMIKSLELQADSLEKDIFQKNTLRDEAVRLSWKYRQEIDALKQEGVKK